MRIYYIPHKQWSEWMSGYDLHGTQPWEKMCEEVAELGFDTVLTAPLRPDGTDALHGRGERSGGDARPTSPAQLTGQLSTAAGICQRHGLQFMVDIAPGNREEADVSDWARTLISWAEAGVAGFRCSQLAAIPPEHWGQLVGAVHERFPDCIFLAWTPGLTPQQLQALHGCCFEATFLSLPWWDYRAQWLIEEYDRLSVLAPVFVPVQNPDESEEASGPALTAAQVGRAIETAAFAGRGWLMVRGTESLVEPAVIRRANAKLANRSAGPNRLRRVSGPLSPITAIFRYGEPAELLLVNPDKLLAVSFSRGMLGSRLPGGYAVSDDNIPDTLQACEGITLGVVQSEPVRGGTSVLGKRKTTAPPLTAPRVAIENITPAVDGGRYPVKRCVGDTVVVEADVFTDGHDKLAVELLWRPADETTWRREPMLPLGNDRWRADFSPQRLGRHCYTVQAWRDAWQSYREGLRKKFEAGQDVSLEAEEGRLLLAAASDRISDDMPEASETLSEILRTVGHPRGPRPKPRRRASSGQAASIAQADGGIPAATEAEIELLLSDRTAEVMKEVDDHPFEVMDIEYPLTVDRREAAFASWYELFPRSQSPVAGRHGTFIDVIGRLPAIRDMGFDVLYMPPIHPIGMRNRKGRNNALQAGPDDPGSPYAIGSPDGGHDAVHPALGTLDDFQELVQATQAHGMEVAMDFAIQCSPDHPWLGEDPDWFDWRADGSLRYAENPPKRYEDIVNPDFYSPLASAARQAALWRALRDVILFWVEQGVRIFRVDNPHTKPLPFWEWMIGQVQAEHPDVLFLSEAFTRPRMMYRLAKIGYTQSYTYFTWRNTKHEITEYLTELNTSPVADFFRPNFFVNTPDINPYFLQTSGRAGFLIRAALATLTSGLWGMYNGFELCEAQSLPGKEEYLDSEKYELRAWDWDRPGNIIPEITRLNHIRRCTPALQSHLGIRFHRVDNDQILFFSKSTPDGDSVVLVAISLDPQANQGGTLELPSGQATMLATASEALAIHELFDDRRFVLHGNRHYVELTPERPFLVWAVNQAR